MKSAVLAVTFTLFASSPVLAQVKAPPPAATGGFTTSSALPSPTVVPGTWDLWKSPKDIGRIIKGETGADGTRTTTVAGGMPESTYGQVFDICKLNPKLPQCVGLVDVCIVNPKSPQCQKIW